MAQNQMNKLVWIVNTISKAGKISFEDINRKWRENEFLSGGQEMIKRTFHKWRDSIFDTFGLIIECEQGGLYRYYIRNSSELRNGSLENWLLRTYSISNSLIESKSIKDKIVLEDIPSGVNFLAPMHATQIERERHEDYSIFELDIRPTYDFKQEILKYGEKLEVLKPVWLREEIVGIVQRMLNKYSNKLGRR